MRGLCAAGGSRRRRRGGGKQKTSLRLSNDFEVEVKEKKVQNKPQP